MKKILLFTILLFAFIVKVSAQDTRNQAIVSKSDGITVSFSSSGSYEWEYSNGKLQSTNYQQNSTSSVTTMTITSTKVFSLYFDYSVSSESGCDKLTVTLNGTKIVDGISGTKSDTWCYSNIEGGTFTLVFTYTKDYSEHTNDDRAYISNIAMRTTGSTQNVVTTYTPGSGVDTYTKSTKELLALCGVKTSNYIKFGTPSIVVHGTNQTLYSTLATDSENAWDYYYAGSKGSNLSIRQPNPSNYSALKGDESTDGIRITYPKASTNTYEFKLTIYNRGSSGSSTLDTYNLNIMISPSGLVRYLVYPMCSYNMNPSSTTISATEASNGYSLYMSNVVMVTPTMSVTSAQTFSGATISGGYGVQEPTFYTDLHTSPGYGYYSYQTKFTTTKPGIYTVRASYSGGSDYVITVNRYTGSLAVYGSNKTINEVRGEDIRNVIGGLSTASDGTPTFTMTNSDGNAVTLTNNIIPSDLPVGTYTVSASIPQTDSYTACNDSYTLTVTKGTNSLAYTPQEFNTRAGHASFDMPGAISTNNSDGAITYSCANANVVINGTKVSFKRPGTYTINASQAATDTYQAKETSFTITVPAQKLKKVHSCMIDDYNMSEWYDGAEANTWTSNTPNLRYLSPKDALLSSEMFIASGLNALETTYGRDGLHSNRTMVKFSDPVQQIINSDRMLIDSRNMVVSNNPTFYDSDKFDYVVPGNAEISLLMGGAVSPAKSAGMDLGTTDFNFGGGGGDDDDIVEVINGQQTQNVTFVRTEGLPAVGHYGTICLPFSVPISKMPEGFVFEEHTGTSDFLNDSGTLFMVFTQVGQLTAGKPYIFKRTDSSKTELRFEVPASMTTLAVQPDIAADVNFLGTFINLITEDLHCETAKNPYNNGSSVASSDELDNYFNKLYDEGNGRVGYFLKTDNGRDVIRRANNNVSVRPFRAFFRLNESDWTTAIGHTPVSAKQMDVVYIEHEGDDYTTSVREFTPVNLSSLQLDVYDIHGRKVASDVDEEDPTDGLQPGIYLLSNGKKVLKK